MGLTKDDIDALATFVVVGVRAMIGNPATDVGNIHQASALLTKLETAKREIDAAASMPDNKAAEPKS